MDEITVKIKFNREITPGDAKRFVELLDEELGWTLDESAQRWKSKTPGKGWGMGKALVSDVKLHRA